MLPPAEIFSACASVLAYIVTAHSIFNAAVPPQFQRFVLSVLSSRFGRSEPATVTVAIEDKAMNGTSTNTFYRDAAEYIGTKARRDGTKLKATRESEGAKHLNIALGDEEVIHDLYEGIKIEYRYLKVENSEPNRSLGKHYLEIRFEEKHRDMVFDKYFPYVARIASDMRSRNKVTAIQNNSSGNRWEKVNLIHPSTFDTMAMNIDLKNLVLDDINRFIRRKEFYRKVGKAWKRGYLLYGPPGTGKSSLVAAIANYLNFDIFDLQLNSVQDDISLKKLLLQISNSSILLVEDIDRSLNLQTDPAAKGLSMAGLLNCIDGIWSSCGDERIIVFTTNNKDLLDPALIRPGRMDMHIYMGYCSFEGFRVLAGNYLGLDDHAHHSLFPEIERLIEGDVVTPAQVAEELMKTDDADLALGNLIELLETGRSLVSSTEDGMETGMSLVSSTEDGLD